LIISKLLIYYDLGMDSIGILERSVLNKSQGSNRIEREIYFCSIPSFSFHM